MGKAHEAVQYIQDRTSLADEVHVTAEGNRTITLKGPRKKADGSTQEVTIEVRDSGPGAGQDRYAAIVSADGIEPIHGNPDETLELALANVDAHSSALG